MPRDRSAAGLDALNFFVANVQTGFGPFIAAYLASQAWTQGQIGLALSIGTLTTMVVQVPAGALVDAVRDKRGLGMIAIASIAGAALILAAFPERLPVLLAEVLHGLASCLLGPVIAVLSMAVAQAAGQPFGERLGAQCPVRLDRQRHRGRADGRGGLLGLGTLGVRAGRPARHPGLPRPAPGSGAEAAARPKPPTMPLRLALTDRRLMLFAASCACFHLANAAMFPLAAVEVTRRTGSVGQLVIAACLIVPQLLVAAMSPGVGRAAERWGRRPVLLFGFAAVPLRGALFALTAEPWAVVAVQTLDGVSGAVFGVMLPLVVADIARDSGRFNLSMGAIDLAIAAAASASNEVAGLATDWGGPTVAFLTLSASGIVAFLLLWATMPETGRAPRPATA